MAPEVERVRRDVNADTVNGDLLAYIAGDDVGIVSVLAQVVILPFYGAVTEIKCFADILLYRLIVRGQCKEKMMEDPDVVTRLHRDVVFSSCRECFNRFSIGKNIDPLLRALCEMIALVNCITAHCSTGKNERGRKEPDVLEGCIDILKLSEHGCEFLFS